MDLQGNAKITQIAQRGAESRYITMAEARKKEKDMEAATDYWRRAHDTLIVATKIATFERPKPIAAHELAPVHYLLGYCRVNQCETAPKRKQPGLLREAQGEFKTCRRLDPRYYKAQRALDRLQEKTPSLPSDWLIQPIAPIAVVILACGILGGAQWAKFWGWGEDASPGFKLTEAILTMTPSFSKEREKELISKLSPSFGKTFASRDALLEYLKELAGEKWVGYHGEALVTHAFIPLGPPQRRYLSEGYWALLSIGALLFMIAGLYARDLTKLNIGPLGLEKGKTEQVEAGGTLGLTVESMTVGAGT